MILFAGIVLFLTIAEVTVVFGANIINSKLKIGMVENSFTGAAYRDQGFYDFYKKHRAEIKIGNNVTSDLNLLTTKIPNYSPQYHVSIFEDFPTHLRKIFPSTNVSILSDIDVHEGEIFNVRGNDTSSNAYDILILGHQEYVTQQEYDNFKRFVANGGILVLLDGNVFYAEVKYDENTNSISLIKGHYWEFNGKSAWRSVEERWKNETSEWIGSNFLCCWSLKFKFNNNPFEMKHDEEQHITNPKAKILLDYNATEDKPNPRNPKVATYELDYKKGKVIVLGLYTDHFTKNERFWKFFDSLFFRYALSGKTS